MCTQVLITQGGKARHDCCVGCFEFLEPVLILGCVSCHFLFSAWKLHSPLKAQNKGAQGYLFFEILLNLRRSYLFYVFTIQCQTSIIRIVLLTMTPVLKIKLYQGINDIT